MTGSMQSVLRNSAQENEESIRTTGKSEDGKEDMNLSVQEEILAELRAVNEVLKNIANTMETMEQSFWT